MPQKTKISECKGKKKIQRPDSYRETRPEIDKDSGNAQKNINYGF